jgi:ADP-heptose:LPS heptosyltransferase
MLIWEHYLKSLKDLGISVYSEWREEWKKLFVKDQYNPKYILIFPGSGHRLKNWPIENFLTLEKCLTHMGEKVIFVLGPVEIERKLHIGKQINVVYPSNLNELQKVLLSAKLVIGNDSGPMHLAGFNGIPIISIFGPTDPNLWGPLNSKIVTPKISCAPCTSLIDIKCSDNKCIRSIQVSEVFNAVRKVLISNFEISRKKIIDKKD